MSNSETRMTTHGRATLVAVLLCALLAGLIGTFALHSIATDSYSASFSAGRTLGQREASARYAHWLEPWNQRLGIRAKVMDGWLRGKQLLDTGDYNGAIAALDAAYRLDIGDAELLALYRQAQDAQALATNRKAHLQHGHEGPGGTLTPDQIER